MNHTIAQISEEEAILLLDIIALIELVKNKINQIEYTGDFNAATEEHCSNLLNTLNAELMKKLIRTI
jgi:hypothetical protein